MKREMIIQKLAGAAMIGISLLVAAINGGQTSVLPILLGTALIGTKEKCFG